MRIRAYYLYALLAVVFTAASDAATTNCPSDFYRGTAPDLVNQKLAVKARELCFSEFAVMHSGLTRTPLYSADHLTAQRVELARRQRREDAANTFHEEERLPPAERSTLRDFSRSGYDRGHTSPNGDFDNPLAQGESFSLANMVPQNPNNNRNLWEGVEEATRSIAERYGEAWVVTVPVFSGAQTLWLHDRVAIPSRMAKAVYVPATHQAAVYLTSNVPGRAWQSISVAQLRDLTGIDVFPALPESVKRDAAALPSPTVHGHHSNGY